MNLFGCWVFLLIEDCIFSKDVLLGENIHVDIPENYVLPLLTNENFNAQLVAIENVFGTSTLKLDLLLYFLICFFLNYLVKFYAPWCGHWYVV